jgi:hypothetical protein
MSTTVLLRNGSGWPVPISWTSRRVHVEETKSTPIGARVRLIVSVPIEV